MNPQTIIVLSLVALIVLAVVVCGVINRRRGKRSCSCSCSACAMKDVCHPEKKDG